MCRGSFCPCRCSLGSHTHLRWTHVCTGLTTEQISLILIWTRRMVRQVPTRVEKCSLHGVRCWAPRQAIVAAHHCSGRRRMRSTCCHGSNGTFSVLRKSCSSSQHTSQTLLLLPRLQECCWMLKPGGYLDARVLPNASVRFNRAAEIQVSCASAHLGLLHNPQRLQGHNAQNNCLCHPRLATG